MTKKHYDEHWNELDEEATDLLNSAAADEFARALDRGGWMIIRKPFVVWPKVPQFSGGPLDSWEMNGPGECPVWAEPATG